MSKVKSTIQTISCFVFFQLYAVGSKGHTDLLDARTLQRVGKSISPRGGNSNGANGIRSVSFRGNILTIGTAIGTMLFWDLRAEKFLDTAPNGNRIATLKVNSNTRDTYRGITPFGQG